MRPPTQWMEKRCELVSRPKIAPEVGPGLSKAVVWATFEASLAGAPEAVASRPVGRPLPAQSCQARPEEAREPRLGAAKGAL